MLRKDHILIRRITDPLRRRSSRAKNDLLILLSELEDERRVVERKARITALNLSGVNTLPKATRMDFRAGEPLDELVAFSTFQV
jgi:hypothetical protein